MLELLELSLRRHPAAGIPEEDRFGNADVVNTTKQGWQERIFHSIRAVFGYGL